MLEAKGIHKTYISGKKTLEVLKGVDILVESASFVAVVGPSGAGKSTLLHILGGLDAPTKGSVLFNGEGLYESPEGFLDGIRNTSIGFVFQFYHLLPEFTVLENVMLPCLIQRSVKHKEIEKNSRLLLERVGLKERADYFPPQLSGGEKQRAAIVRALVNKPKLLLCDEPTGNLDSRSGKEVLDLILTLNQEKHMSVVLVTHNQDLAQMADRIYHLKDGVLVDSGS